LADHLSEIGVSFMTIGADTAAEQHICVGRLIDEDVAVDVERLDNFTDVHVVHLPRSMKNVLLTKNK
jgi:hypothetical protein